MKLFKPLALSLAITLAGCASDAPTPSLPDGVAYLGSNLSQQAEVTIPYEKFQLDNGLTVVLHKDGSDPLVHVDVTYHVGSAREELGKSGFAHFFEHMMFQGSENVADEQHFQLVTESGGTLNGTTNSDRTNYFETVPANQLEKMLWLEADRMGFLLPAVTEEAFEVQRATVKNERGQRVDNQPYGRLNELVSQALYPKGHPYSWPVIGWMEELDNGNVDDLRAFFKRWYGPNNATLTIGGDFDRQQVLQWVVKYFGSIPRGPEVTAQPKAPAALDADRYLTLEDKVHLPLIYLSFPTVYARHEDEAALDLLSEILGGGKTSIFYKNLVKSGLAVQAGVGHPCRELACEFTMYALANPGKMPQLDGIEKVIRDSVAEFEKRGVLADDLKKAQVGHEANTIFGLQSVRGKVTSLAYNQTFFDEPDLLQQDLERYRNVTAEDVMRVFNTYIKGKHAVIMSVVPQGQLALAAASASFTAPGPIPKDQLSHAGKVEQAQIQDSFDRSQVPGSGPAPQLKVPALWQQRLANGIDVIGTRSDETPTTEIMIALDGGQRLTSAAEAGLAQLTATMMGESTESFTTEEMAQELEKLGSTISVSASGYRTYVSVSALTANLDATLALLQERLLKPAFKDEDFQRVKVQQIQGLQHQANDPGWLANTAWSELLYGGNSAGKPVGGTLESVQGLTLEQVQGFYKEQFRAGNASVVAVSDLDQPQLMAKLNWLGQWQGDASQWAPLTAMPQLAGPKVYLLDKPGAAQSVIKIGRRGMPFDALGDYFKSGLMNYPLGGAFNSRINLNLREDKGYTYGARSSFRGGPELGSFVAGASVRADATAASVKEFVDELQGFADKGMTEEELAFMRASVTQSDALSFETPGQKARFLGKLQRYDLPKDFVEQQGALIRSISRDELNRLAKDQLDLSQMIILVVGDKSSVEPSLKELGYDIVTLTL
ncbi:M16 family metallopeptidase [Ferrimonas futtsuensis]|uniref:M16 family metallopeptidase n=1 Tax=Ferrimonas futtsuensis TaxID=364764 RepID=UPI000416F227|nr:pitrilysin family protein [Ferrimonas futtsuensis]